MFESQPASFRDAYTNAATGFSVGVAGNVASTRTRLLHWRPEVSIELVLLASSLYFTLLCNFPFWRALLDTRGSEEGVLPYILAIGCVLTALHFLLLAPLSTRFTVRPLLGMLVLVAACAGYFSVNYGIYLDPDMLRNVVRTNRFEASELITPGLLGHLLVFVLPPVILLWRIRPRRTTLLRLVLVRGTGMLLALAVAATSLAYVLKDFSGQMRNHKEIRYLITPSAAIWSLGRVLASDAHAVEGARLPVGTDARLGDSWIGHTRPVVFVIVVGETARAANWGLNRGALHGTTPELARHDAINFSNVRSCGTSTEVSLPCMFSVRGRRNYDANLISGSESLLDTLHHAGLRVVWNDNQSGCKGVCAGVESMRPDPGEMPQLCEGGQCLDEALLDSSRQLLRAANGNLVLVLHQLGNHGPAYHRRYPQAFRRFVPTCDGEDLSRCSREQITNSYDNALLYTDHVLGGVIDLLQELERDHDTAMLYVSDHGESLGEGGLYLHGVPYSIAPDVQKQVPMVMWFSPGFASRMRLDTECLRRIAEEPASHDNLFHTVLGLLDVNTAVRDASLDLAAGCRG